MSPANLAGYFAAHAIWCVADGSTLIPIYATLGEGGAREMKRLAHEMLEDGVAAGREYLANDVTKDRVLIFDGRMMVGGEKLDALFVEWRPAGAAERYVLMGLPYSPPAEGRPFRVHRPKVVEVDEASRAELTDQLQRFWEGVDQHKEGAKVWNQHMDESK